MENMNNDVIIKIEHVSKQYRLGAIGGTTLVRELQTLGARIRGKEDPNATIGSESKGKRGDLFMALDDISFEIKKGERVGIIGHNGAGKSTFLKLLSRVTAPTTGTISYNGRIASMLEVGTGFHPELTGRENVYMNGAILGMKKDEITRKMDDIIKFAEMEKFIDTPVKRYSSGMYVKLAFSVAAHLDSEIMIMDEVLAVGDVNFQQKCIKKMREVADDGRTVLYVSHNMSTIRQLCNRCIVLSHGKVIFMGDVEKAISYYLNENEVEAENHVDFSNMHPDVGYHKKAILNRIDLDHYITDNDQKIHAKLNVTSSINSTFILRMKIFNQAGQIIGSAHLKPFTLSEGNTDVFFDLNLKSLCKGKYIVDLILTEYVKDTQIRHDFVRGAFAFIVSINEYAYGVEWLPNYSGYFVFDDIDVLKMESVNE